MKKIAILIPCYNEEKTIVKVIRDFNKKIPDATIYVYDNNSTDNSYNLAKKENCIIKKVFERGKGNVVRKMFYDIEADCYLLVDADDTYSPNQSKKMCNYILKNEYDMVIGDRLSSTYYQENKKILHSIGNKLVCFLIHVLFSYKINDVMSGYRAFSKTFVKNIPILSNNFELETEMTIHAIIYHYQIKTIPILYKDRQEGSISKIKTIKDGCSIIYTIIKSYIDNYPKRYYTSLSILSIIVSIILYTKKEELYLLFIILSIVLYIIGIIKASILEKYKKIISVFRNR